MWRVCAQETFFQTSPLLPEPPPTPGHSPGRGAEWAYSAGRREAGTSEAADGPGIEDDVLGLEAQAVDSKLDHHVHGIGLILWEWHPLQEDGQRQEWVSTTSQPACRPHPPRVDPSCSYSATEKE